MKSRNVLVVLLVIVFLFTFEAELLAAPGGKIAKAFFKSFWGKLILGILTIVFLPLILIQMFRENRKVKATQKALGQLATLDDNFEILKLNARVKGVFEQVHRAWTKEDMSEASQLMTDWYWQNQQLVYLNAWEERGLVNICRVREVNNVKPILVKATQEPNFENSRISFLISAEMEDYLQEKESGRIVEGAKGFDDEESIWTFVLQNGNWLLENITQEAAYSEFVKMPNVVPQFQTA